jgi:hypothetical protein
MYSVYDDLAQYGRPVLVFLPIGIKPVSYIVANKDSALDPK